MGHELDSTNGVTAFADSRTDAWHGLGQSVGHLMTAEEILRESRLAGWNVRKQAMWTSNIDGTLVEVPDQFATVRTNPETGLTDPLGVVGKMYHPIQNEESAALLNALVDESGAHFETAGALFGGKKVFVTMKLPETMKLELPGGAVDETELYLAAMNSHDGTGAFRVILTPVRIVCRNTQIAGISRAKSSWSVRHMTGATSALEEARSSLKIAFDYVDAFHAEMASLLDRETEAEEARRLLSSVFDVEAAPTERAERLRKGHVDAVLAGLELDTVSAVAGTRFGLYNAITEYSDHRIPRKGGEVGTPADKQLFGSGADLKARAFSVLSA